MTDLLALARNKRLIWIIRSTRRRTDAEFLRRLQSVAAIRKTGISGQTQLLSHFLKETGSKTQFLEAPEFLCSPMVMRREEEEEDQEAFTQNLTGQEEL